MLPFSLLMYLKVNFIILPHLILSENGYLLGKLETLLLLLIEISRSAPHVAVFLLPVVFAGTLTCYQRLHFADEYFITVLIHRYYLLFLSVFCVFNIVHLTVFLFIVVVCYLLTFYVICTLFHWFLCCSFWCFATTGLVCLLSSKWINKLKLIEWSCYLNTQ